MTETITSSSPCRICMDAKIQQVSIFSGDLSRKVSEIADVQVQEGDGLPPSICEDCEIDLERCYRFRTQIIWADSKFRERLSVSEVVFEECHIKQEGQTFINEENQEDDDDDRPPSDNDDDDYDMRDDSGDKIDEIPQEKDQPTDPIDHVEIIENRTKQELHNLPSTDGNSQDEPLIVAQMKRENEPSSDPLMQSESQQPMDTESSIPGPSTSTPTVFGTDQSNLENYPKWRRTMMLSAEIKEEPREETNQKQETVRPKQLAMSYLQMQQIYNPMLQSMIQTNQSDFRHFMALQEQTGQQGKPGVGLTTLSEKQITAEKPLENKSVENQSNDASVVDESTSQEKDSELIKKNRTVSPKKPPKREVRAKRLLPKRLQAPKSQTVVQKRPKPLRPKAKVSGKPFQTHDEMTCFVCNIFCGHVDVLEEHFKGDKNVCRVCTRTFTVHAELETHFTSHKPSTCNSCGAVNYCKADYYKHLRENPACNVFDTDLKCDLCDKTFTRKRTLRIHKIQHHTNNEAKYKCIVCHKPFNLLWMLNLHLTKTHFVSEHIECQICHRIFLGVDSLKNHMNIKHFTGSEQAKSFQCTICCQNFNKESSLMSHMKHRHDKTESLCEDCGMSVFGYKAMQEHKRMYHPKDNETFICEFCHQTFDEYKPYRQHRKSYHHKKPEPQFCEICGKGFKNLSTLKHHYAVHKDERKWECEICKATFKQKVALTTHGRVHSDVKQYVCDNCGESFRWKQTFDKHIKLCSGSHTNM